MADKKTTKVTPTDSRGALLEAAKRVFAEKGFEGATVKDLADEAGVNISMVSYYFGGKEGLYRAAVETFGLERVEATERILKGPTSSEDFKVRLKIFAEGFIDIHKTEHDVCKIIHRGVEACDPILMDLFNSVFHRVFLAFQNFVDNAQKAGIVRSDIDVEITSSLVFGGLMQSIRADELRKLMQKKTLDDPDYRESVVDHWVQTLTTGIFPQTPNLEKSQ